MAVSAIQVHPMTQECQAVNVLVLICKRLGRLQITIDRSWTRSVYKQRMYHTEMSICGCEMKWCRSFDTGASDFVFRLGNIDISSVGNQCVGNGDVAHACSDVQRCNAM